MIEDYIGIRGDTTDPAPFQGSASVCMLTSGDGGSGTLEESSLSDALWEAQSTYISKESEYLAQLNAEWKETEDLMGSGKLDNLLDLLGEVIEEGIGYWVFEWLGKAGIVLSGGKAAIVAVLVSIAAGFGWGKLREAFADWLKEGNKLLEAMIAENTALLEATKSVENYRLRNDVILRHERVLYRLLDELSKLQQQYDHILVDDRRSTDDEWDDVLASIGNETGKIATWLNDMEVKDAADLPIPAPPNLPAPPEGSKGAKLRVAYMLAKYGFTLFTEVMKKQRETDTHLTDLVQAVDDLKFNGQRIHTEHGDVIEYTGIGTVAASYNT